MVSTASMVCSDNSVAGEVSKTDTLSCAHISTIEEEGKGIVDVEVGCVRFEEPSVLSRRWWSGQ
jgi:hypothetical protein